MGIHELFAFIGCLMVDCHLVRFLCSPGLELLTRDMRVMLRQKTIDALEWFVNIISRCLLNVSEISPTDLAFMVVLYVELI